MKKTSLGYCFYCNKETLIGKNKTNYFFLVVLSILTIGMWFFLWFFYLRKRYKCSECKHLMKKDDAVDKYGKSDIIFDIIISIYFILFFIIIIYQLYFE